MWWAVFGVLTQPMSRIKIKEGGYKEGFTKDFKLVPKLESYMLKQQKNHFVSLSL
jgi:hypothetical protein